MLGQEDLQCQLAGEMSSVLQALGEPPSVWTSSGRNRMRGSPLEAGERVGRCSRDFSWAVRVGREE